MRSTSRQHFRVYSNATSSSVVIFPLVCHHDVIRNDFCGVLSLWLRAKAHVYRVVTTDETHCVEPSSSLDSLSSVSPNIFAMATLTCDVRAIALVDGPSCLTSYPNQLP